MNKFITTDEICNEVRYRLEQKGLKLEKVSTVFDVSGKLYIHAQSGKQIAWLEMLEPNVDLSFFDFGERYLMPAVEKLFQHLIPTELTLIQN